MRSLVLGDFFTEFLAGAGIGVFAGIFAGLVAVPLLVLVLPGPVCPFCRIRLGRFSRFKIGQPALWGEYICPGCQRPIEKKDLRKKSA